MATETFTPCFAEMAGNGSDGGVGLGSAEGGVQGGGVVGGN